MNDEPADILVRARASETDLTIKVWSHLHGKRIWRRVGVRDHVTRDGRQMILAVWETPCAVCNAPFEILTTMRVTRADQGHSFKKLVTCPAHRMTMSESTAIRFAGDYRRAVFEMIRKVKLNRSPGASTPFLRPWRTLFEREPARERAVPHIASPLCGDDRRDIDRRG